MGSEGESESEARRGEAERSPDAAVPDEASKQEPAVCSASLMPPRIRPLSIFTEFIQYCGKWSIIEMSSVLYCAET